MPSRYFHGDCFAFRWAATLNTVVERRQKCSKSDLKKICDLQLVFPKHHFLKQLFLFRFALVGRGLGLEHVQRLCTPWMDESVGLPGSVVL